MVVIVVTLIAVALAFDADSRLSLSMFVVAAIAGLFALGPVGLAAGRRVAGRESVGPATFLAVALLAGPSDRRGAGDDG